MKKATLFLVFALLFLSNVSSQVSVFLSDVGAELSIEGDELYYLDDNFYDIFKVDISDIDFPIISFVFDSDELEIVNGGILAFSVDGTDLYFSTISEPGFPEFGKINKKDLSDLASDAVEVSSGFASTVADIDFQGAWLYTSNLHHGDEAFKRYNISGSLPVSSTTFIARDVTALTINGGSMYFSESVYDGGFGDGEIYFKNLFLGTPEVLKFTAIGLIHDLYFFEGLLYFTDDDGLKRINPIEALPTSELLVTNTDFGNLQKIQVKSYVDGNKYLFVSESDNNRILKVDLTDPALSTLEYKELLFHIFPNPVEDHLTIKTPFNIEEISIYNLLGQRVKNISANSKNSIDMSHLKSGIYFVEVKSDNNTSTKRIIKK